MIKLTKIFVSIFLLLVVFIHTTSAQYYSWGSDPVSLKWSSLKGESGRIIYPDTVDMVARRTLHYLEEIVPVASFGWEHPAMKIPIIMHPENFASNGLVMWMPKRIDFLTTPDTDDFSMLWSKHLTAHEYRHAVQYSNLNRGVIRVLSYILGEQGAALGLLFLPLPIIEGDAVKFETSLSTYGRGLQPSFSMGYRAIGRDMLDRKNIDRWYSGSYLEYIPDHYQLGYQLVDYTYTKYNENIWQKVAERGVRRPYYVITTSLALNKYYGVDNSIVFRDTFNDLFDYWDSLPERENTTEIISEIETKNYTTYSHPIPLEDGDVLALKEDYDKSERFVRFNPNSGEEERIAYVGSPSTRPTVGRDRVWWSEYRYSKLFLQKVNSTLCYMDIERGKPQTVNRVNNTLYPTAIGKSDQRLAYVEYDPKGVYSIVEVEIKGNKVKRDRDLKEISRVTIAQPTEIHGLAWDDRSNNLYFIATDDSGMWLGALDKSSKKGYRQLNEGAYITLSDLRAGGGKLYFGSIESGYDELHCYDLTTETEYQISQSQYGSFDPSVDVDGRIYATTYDKYGYHLSTQKLGVVKREVKRTQTPQNIVNPPRTEWNLLCLDTVNYTPEVAKVSHEEHKSCKYNKGLKLLNIHSWLPVAFNPFDLSAEQIFDVTAGLTLVSQNLLSSTEAYLSYGYSNSQGSVVNGSIDYRGLGVDLVFSGSYGGDQIIYTPYGSINNTEKKHYSFTTSAILPLLYQRGYHSRYLSFSTSWNYSNGLSSDLEFIYDERDGTYLGYEITPLHEGVHKLATGVAFSDSVQSAYRSPTSPWGYYLSAYYALSPTDREFSDLISSYAKFITPGFGRHNSLSIEACYQTSVGKNRDSYNYKMFSSVSLLPRGFISTDVDNNNYFATSLNYQFPICYPTGGIGSILYFRRIRLNVGLDAARYDDLYSGNTQKIYSYGGDLILDINPLRMPDASTTSIKMSLYQPSRGSISFTIGTELPF
ncbi:MAG: hypothetical protein SNF68_06115 [Rikenellaceae bacterium]